MDLANGRYRARAKEWGLGESSTGKEQVAVAFEFTDSEYIGQGLTWYGYFTESALDITVRALRTMGWSGTDLLELSGLDTNEVELVVENEEYNGRTSAKVQFVNPIGGLALKTPMTPEKQKSFAAQMRERIAALDAFEGRKPAAKPKSTVKRPADPRPEPPPISDDIPF